MGTGAEIQGFGAGVPSSTIALAIAPDKTGTALAIALSQPGNSAEQWTFAVEVQTPEGVFFLGTFRTNPPASGDPASRVVALAGCPGAIGWRVVPFGPRGARAVVKLASSGLSIAGVNGGQAAITPCHGSRLTRRVWPAPPAGGGALASKGVISATPRTLTKVYGHLDPAAAGGWFMLFDKATAPVAADVPRVISWPLAPGGAPFSFTADPDGIDFATGISWGISANPLTFVAPAPGDVGLVQAEVI